jgi:hypothetical protein
MTKCSHFASIHSALPFVSDASLAAMAGKPVAKPFTRSYGVLGKVSRLKFRSGRRGIANHNQALPCEVVSSHGLQARVHREIIAGLKGVTRYAMKRAIHLNLACCFFAHGANRGSDPGWNRLDLSVQVAVEFLCVCEFTPFRRHITLQGLKRWVEIHTCPSSV